VLSKDKRDELRSLLVYGFKEKLKADSDHFSHKFQRLSQDLVRRGFRRIDYEERVLTDKKFPLLIMGLWIAKSTS
jgi:hypothetical protein